MLSKKNILYAVGSMVALLGCDARDNHPGYEYGPQMYHSAAYDPLSLYTEEEVKGGFLSQYYYLNSERPNNMPINEFGGKYPSNLLLPASGTVARQNFTSVSKANRSKPGQELLIYNIAPTDFALAGQVLKNPLDSGNANIVEEGKHLYLGFCAPCHGEAGNGQGKVGVVYKGVAVFQSQAIKNVPEGHIFHVITHGKGRMWPHKSQLNPEERWKVVRYVQKLQKGEQ